MAYTGGRGFEREVAHVSFVAQQLLIIHHQHKVFARYAAVKAHAYLEGDIDRGGEGAQLF